MNNLNKKSAMSVTASLIIQQNYIFNMLEQIEDYAVILMDLNGYIQNWNRGAERIKGYGTKEIIGSHFSIFYTPEDIAIRKPWRLIEKALTEGKATDEGWRIRKGGGRFWGSITISLFHDNDRMPIGFCKITRDLTDKKLAQETLAVYTRNLEDKNRELQQFTFLASHDLQEPLRTISSLILLMERKYGRLFDENAVKTFGYIIGAADRMKQLIQSLLQYSRIGRDSKKTVINNFRGLFDSVCRDLENLSTENRSTITSEGLPESITGFEVEFRILFQNLLSNAIKFSKPCVPPVINVRAEEKEREWQFSVKDNGIGFHMKYHDKLFMPFQKLHRKDDYEGEGIGLSHCMKIVQMHNGRLWAESTPGEGAIFYFTILKP